MSGSKQEGTAKRLPPNAGKGRKVGSPNKVTASIKQMVEQALIGAGGVEYLMERAQDPRTASAFLSLVGKVLPIQVTGANGGPVVFERIVREIVEPGAVVAEAREIVDAPRESMRLQ